MRVQSVRVGVLARALALLWSCHARPSSIAHGSTGSGSLSKSQALMCSTHVQGRLALATFPWYAHPCDAHDHVQPQRNAMPPDHGIPRAPRPRPANTCAYRGLCRLGLGRVFGYFGRRCLDLAVPHLAHTCIIVHDEHVCFCFCSCVCVCVRAAA